LKLSTLVLRMRRPELLDFDMDEPLPEELVRELEAELERMKAGR
jgi:hypothetical protein